MNKLKEGGFTLIELMIAIAIVGILLSLAVPAYQDYTVRAKVADALNIAASMKVLIGEYYISQAKLPASTKEAEDAGIETVATDYVKKVEYTTEGAEGADPTAGILTLTLGGDIGGDANDKKFVLKAKPEDKTKILKWTCETADEDPLKAKYLPAQCR